MAFNIVEAIQPPDADCAFDQPCKFGHRVEGHAVYCHNDKWSDSPRKCRRTWYTNGETKDEDCPGFQPNPEYKGALNPTPQSGDRCTRCGGTRLINVDRDTTETCPRCMGDGAEPRAMALSEFEQGTLERGLMLGSKEYEYYATITSEKTERNSVLKLRQLDLVIVRSIQFGPHGVTVYLLKLTAKGDAVMRANWEVKKA